MKNDYPNCQVKTVPKNKNTTNKPKQKVQNIAKIIKDKNNNNNPKDQVENNAKVKQKKITSGQVRAVPKNNNKINNKFKCKLKSLQKDDKNLT